MLFESILSATRYSISSFGSENQGGHDDFHIAAVRGKNAFRPVFTRVCRTFAAFGATVLLRSNCRAARSRRACRRWRRGRCGGRGADSSLFKKFVNERSDGRQERQNCAGACASLRDRLRRPSLRASLCGAFHPSPRGGCVASQQQWRMAVDDACCPDFATFVTE